MESALNPAPAIAPTCVSTAPGRPGVRGAHLLAAMALAAGFFLQAPVALAANGDCSQPNSNGSGPSASDCLFILKVAVGQTTCSPECICAPKGTLPTVASDALLCLKKSVGQSVTLNCPCEEPLPDGDDFNDEFTDPNLWSDDFVNGNGVLDETDQVLEYRCAVGTDYDQSLRDWLGSLLPYDADWEVQLDVANLTVPGGNTQYSSIGLSVIESVYFGNEIFTEIYSSRFGGPPVRDGFYTALYADEEFVDESDTDDLGVASGALRVAFDSAGKVITLYYDINPANGYTWVEFGSFGVDGSGGSDGNANWGLTGSDTFLVSIYGYSSDMTIGSGQVYADDFQVTGGVPFP